MISLIAVDANEKHSLSPRRMGVGGGALRDCGIHLFVCSFVCLSSETCTCRALGDPAVLATTSVQDDSSP